MTDQYHNLDDAYRAQDEYDDTVVEYAASPDQAGCGCVGCGSSVLALAMAAIIALAYPVVTSWFGFE